MLSFWWKHRCNCTSLTSHFNHYFCMVVFSLMLSAYLSDFNPEWAKLGCLSDTFLDITDVSAWTHCPRERPRLLSLSATRGRPLSCILQSFTTPTQTSATIQPWGQPLERPLTLPLSLTHPLFWPLLQPLNQPWLGQIAMETHTLTLTSPYLNQDP